MSSVVIYLWWPSRSFVASIVAMNKVRRTSQTDRWTDIWRLLSPAPLPTRPPTTDRIIESINRMNLINMYSSLETVPDEILVLYSQPTVFLWLQLDFYAHFARDNTSLAATWLRPLRASSQKSEPSYLSKYTIKTWGRHFLSSLGVMVNFYGSCPDFLTWDRAFSTQMSLLFEHQKVYRDTLR